MKEIMIKEIDGNNIIATDLISKTDIVITDFALFAEPKLLTFDSRILIKIILGNTKYLSNVNQACELFIDLISRNQFINLID
jgi:hypothetical protein